tara:strand:+ start:55 stop:219 length:165 start_codon:yes stop_codon:yes gene_type:complete
MDAHHRKIAFGYRLQGDKMKFTKYKYTCWHCGTGMVVSLPAVCPECDRLLNKEA